MVGVLAFMTALVFCRSLLECAHNAAKLAGAGASACAECAECGLHYGERERWRHALLALLVLWGVGKPCALLLAPLAREWAAGAAPLWSVYFVDVALNLSAVARANSTLAGGPAAATVTLRRTEGLVLVMPFALLSASSTWTWATLKGEGFFDADQVWDAELFVHRGMQLYEVVYALEVCALLFALLCIAGEPVGLGDATLVGATLTLALFYFFAGSRARGQGVADSIFGLTLVALVVSVAVAFVAEHTRGCWVQQSGAAALALALLALTLAHASGPEERAAGEVILLRTLISSAAGVYLTALAAVDRDAQCGGGLW
ncbi:MAG: hypothetical protein EBR09_16785 [Proteobacteria bacterium]|nr:hypothetical protein [Pseudomonadota bacterium]